MKNQLFLQKLNEVEKMLESLNVEEALFYKGVVKAIEDVKRGDKPDLSGLSLGFYRVFDGEQHLEIFSALCRLETMAREMDHE